MQRMLYTIGFSGKTAEEFFALLQSAGVEQVIDIRVNRGGQLSGFAKHPDLAYLLQAVARISYAHEPLLAPPPELLKRYRKEKDWPAYEAGFLTEMNSRGVPKKLETALWPPRVALLCSEPGPEKCHRRLVAELLSAFWREQGESAEIRHLVSRNSKTSKPRAKKTGSVA